MGARDDVLAFVSVMASDPTSDEQVVERLVALGFSPLRAELLAAVVPLAFFRAVIKRFPNPPIVADSAMIWDSARDRSWEVKLADIPEFTAAAQVAEERFSSGVIPPDQFRKCCNSSEFDAINKTEQAGRPISGGTMSPPFLLRLADQEGFDKWYRSHRPRPRRARPWWRFWG